MPIKLIRLFVALSMAFLVPLQGIAAATAGLCMTFGHHESAPAAAHDHAAVDHQHEADETGGSAHCPPCVACCAAAAISSSDRVFFPEAPVSSVVSVAPPLISGVVPDKLDRPPLAL